MKFILGPQVARLTIPTTEGDAPVRPSFMLQLSYEYQIRDKAFELVREMGTSLAQALKWARTDSELRSLKFTTPLTIESTKRKQDQVSLWKPPTKYQKGEGKGDYKGKGKDKGKDSKGRGGRNQGKGAKGKGKMNDWNGLEICYRFNNKDAANCPRPCPRAHVCQMRECNGAKHAILDCPVYKRLLEQNR